MNRLDYIASKLTNVRRLPDGFIARCPVCAIEGSDKQGQHLRVWPSAAYRCAKAGDDKDHNRLIRSFIYPDDYTLSGALDSDSEYIDPDPRPDVDPIYDESLLSRLVKDYSYWMGRGISSSTLERIGGGVAPLDTPSKLAGRYVFPIRDEESRIVGFTGRLIQPNSFAPNWKHMMKTSRVCWPWCLNSGEITKARTVVLLESIGDALTLATHGVWCWLVMFGLHLNGKTLGHLVATNPLRIIISTNNDSIGKPESQQAGNKAALKLRDQLVRFFPEERVLIRLPQTKKDWNAADPAEIETFKGEIYPVVSL